GDGGGRRFPDAFRVLRDLQRRAAAADAWNVAPAQLHFLRVRREDPERDAAIALHVRRDDHRALRLLRHERERRNRAAGANEEKKQLSHPCLPGSPALYSPAGGRADTTAGAARSAVPLPGPS